jgi:hypothetical protein
MPFIRTSVVKTEVHEVKADPNADTIGQQIDRMIAESLERPWDGRLHEVTFGFETDEDFHRYARELADMQRGEFAVPTKGKRPL